MKAVVFLMLVVLLGAVLLGHTLKAVSISEAETQNLRVQLQATQAALSKSQADLQSLTQKLAAIEAERDTALNANNSLLALMEDLKGSVETLRGENEALRRRVQELEQALQVSQAQSTSGVELGALFQSRGLWAILAPAFLIVLVGAGYSGLRLTSKFKSVPHTLAYAAKTGSPRDTVVVRMPRERVPKYVRWSRQVEKEGNNSLIKKD